MFKLPIHIYGCSKLALVAIPSDTATWMEYITIMRAISPSYPDNSILLYVQLGDACILSSGQLTSVRKLLRRQSIMRQ